MSETRTRPDQTEIEDYRWMVGPEPVAQLTHPEKEMALVEGEMVPVEEALRKIVQKVSQVKKAGDGRPWPYGSLALGRRASGEG